MGPSDVVDLLASDLADRPGWSSPLVFVPEDRPLQMDGALSARARPATTSPPRNRPTRDLVPTGPRSAAQAPTLEA